jgi:hypothetical protein
MPIDAGIDLGVPPDARDDDPGDLAPSICESSDLPGLLATYTFGDARVARRREAGLDRGALADFEFGFVPATPFSAVWDARFRVENPLREQFVVDTNGRASLRIDNEVVWEGTGTGTVEADLRPGSHTLSLQVDDLGAAPRVRLKEGPVGSLLRVVGGPGFHATADCDDEGVSTLTYRTSLDPAAALAVVARGRLEAAQSEPLRVRRPAPEADRPGRMGFLERGSHGHEVSPRAPGVLNRGRDRDAGPWCAHRASCPRAVVPWSHARAWWPAGSWARR